MEPQPFSYNASPFQGTESNWKYLYDNVAIFSSGILASPLQWATVRGMWPLDISKLWDLPCWCSAGQLLPSSAPACFGGVFAFSLNFSDRKTCSTGRRSGDTMAKNIPLFSPEKLHAFWGCLGWLSGFKVKHNPASAVILCWVRTDKTFLYTSEFILLLPSAVTGAQRASLKATVSCPSHNTTLSELNVQKVPKKVQMLLYGYIKLYP